MFTWSCGSLLWSHDERLQRRPLSDAPTVRLMGTDFIRPVRGVLSVHRRIGRIVKCAALCAHSCKRNLSAFSVLKVQGEKVSVVLVESPERSAVRTVKI